MLKLLVAPHQGLCETTPAMSPPPYTFRPATRADLPMLRTWLATPDVVRWWGEPKEQYALLEEDLANPLMVMRIVAYDGRPFAYVQDYEVHTWPQPHFSNVPEGARGIDAFIGVPDMIGRGMAPRFCASGRQNLSPPARR
jgi:aminoglycoside 6'-N-acetyltransferase